MSRHLTEHVRTLTSKGQVTIPVEVRRRLGLRPHDKVAFRITETGVELVAESMTLEETYGSVPALKEPLSETEWRELLVAERSRRYEEKMADSPPGA